MFLNFLRPISFPQFQALLYPTEFSEKAMKILAFHRPVTGILPNEPCNNQAL
jgi:hypothetical protein